MGCGYVRTSTYFRLLHLSEAGCQLRAPFGERTPGIHPIRGWVGPSIGLHDVQRKKNLPLPGLPIRSQWLYRCS
jgi:hypothetical protein